MPSFRLTVRSVMSLSRTLIGTIAQSDGSAGGGAGGAVTRPAANWMFEVFASIGVTVVDVPRAAAAGRGYIRIFTRYWPCGIARKVKLPLPSAMVLAASA